MARETRSSSKPAPQKVEVVKKQIEKPKPAAGAAAAQPKVAKAAPAKKSAPAQKPGIKRTQTMMETQQEGEEYLKREEERMAKEAELAQTKLYAEKSPQKDGESRTKQSKKPSKSRSPPKKIPTPKKTADKQKQTSKPADQSRKASSAEDAAAAAAAPAKSTPTKPAGDVPAKQIEQEKKETVKGIIPRTNSRIGLKGGPTAGLVDVVFCCDTTGSMGSYLNQTKEAVKTIVNKIEQKCKGEDISVLFGFVAYRDHPPQESTYVTQKQDLCQKEEILKFIQSLDASGGGDGPEAVMPGLMEAAKGMSFRSTTKLPTLRYIFHICDAPPHGDLYGGHSSQWQEGDPSGITVEKISHVINIQEIHYRLIKCTNYGLDKMATIFKEKFTNYEETTLSNAQQLDISISDMIIRELCADMDYSLD